jgi:hypothetical protein
MKKSLCALSLCLTFSAFADVPQFSNLSKSDVEDVSKEFGANFSHTSVAAPETSGLWGIEVGVVGGKTKSPDFSDVIDSSGGDGSDFKNIYHGGLMARAHFPFDLFLEATVLPEQEISDVKVKSRSFGLGWNFGEFFNLPLDLAIGLDHGMGEVKFHQDQNIPTSTPDSDIKLKTKTTVYWLGASKTFAFFTPYVKAGVSKIQGDLDATGAILGYTASTSETVNLSGGYAALGANFQLLFFKLGLEGSQIQNTKKVSAKFSFDF